MQKELEAVLSSSFIKVRSEYLYGILIF